MDKSFRGWRTKGEKIGGRVSSMRKGQFALISQKAVLDSGNFNILCKGNLWLACKS